MKYLLIIIASIFLIEGQAQKQPTYGVDSTHNFWWEIEVITYDDQFKMSNYEYLEYQLDESDRIVIMICGDSIPLETHTLTIPKQCLKKKKIVNHTFVTENRDSSKTDSMIVADNESLSNYYIENKDSLRIDTILIKDSNVISSSKPFFLKNRTMFFYDQKHHYEFGYYKLDELKGYCIEKNFRIKYEGWWKFGKKHGLWKEYSPTGKLISKKKYKHGKLKREKEY